MLKKLVRLCLVVCGLFVGCQSHTDSKKIVQTQWQKTTAEIELSVADKQLEQGQHEVVKETAVKCVKVGYELPKAHLMLGKIMLTEGHLEKAEEEFNKAVELDRELHEGWFLLGTIVWQFWDGLR